MNSSSSSRPATPVSSSGSPRPSSHIPPAEAAGTISSLKDKSVNAYQQFLQSLDQIKIQNNLKDELSKENLQLAEENLQKEPRIMELRNQCKTTELATASGKLKELEKQKEEMLKLNSPASLLQRIQESMHLTDEESENLHQQLLVKEVDLSLWSLSPKVMVVTEQDSNHNGSTLMERLFETLYSCATLFDCLESTVSRTSLERLKVEKMLFGEEIKTC